MKEVLYATGFFEIGDTFEDAEGNQHTITDVLVMHYIKRGSYRVLYEVDNAGDFTDLKLRGFGNLEDLAKQVMQQSALSRKKVDNKNLQLIPPQGDDSPTIIGERNP